MLSELNHSPSETALQGIPSYPVLADAWARRWNQDFSGCLELLPQIMQLVRGVSNHQQGLPIHIVIEAKLWVGSLHRMRNQPVLFLESIQDLEKDYTKSELSICRFYYFEKGIAAYLNEHYMQCLEYFVIFRTMARGPAETALALNNELLILDLLGFPTNTAKDKLDNHMKSLFSNLSTVDDLSTLPAPYQGIKTQRVYLDILSKSYQGDFTWITRELKRTGGFLQSHHYAIWSSQLPYVTSNPSTQKKIDALLNQHLQSQDHLFQRNFRSGTLTGRPSALAPGNLVRFMDATERLYLWTWQFVMNPNERWASAWIHSFVELHSIYSQRPHAFVSPSDGWMIKNALTLMCAIVPTLQNKVKAILERATSLCAGHSYPIYEYEYLRIKIMAEHPIERTWLERSILDHPLHTHFAGSFEKIEQQIKTLIAPMSANKENTAPQAVRIDLGKFTLTQPDQTVKYSESICRALVLLSHSKQDQIDCETFVSEVFGLQRYDEWIHLPKIYQLLSRMKSVLGIADGQKLISIREGSIIINRSALPALQLIQGSVLSQFLHQSPSWQQLQLLDTTASHHATSNSALDDEARAISKLGLQFTRSDLEREFKESRATLVRRLNRWIKSGKVIRHGKGKNTIYIFKGETHANQNKK